VAWSCRMNDTWIMHTGLSEILYHNEQTSPLLWAYTYICLCLYIGCCLCQYKFRTL